MSRSSIRTVWTGLLIAAWVVGCSGSETTEPDPAAFASSAGSQPAAPDSIVRRLDGEAGELPVVEAIEFSPTHVESRGRLRAIANVRGEYSSIEYAWSVNGEAFGGNAAEVLLPVLRTGDEVEVQIVPHRGSDVGGSNALSVRVENQRPRLTGLGIELDQVDPDDPWAESGAAEDAGKVMWRARVNATDPDGDEVEIEYSWFVNGQRSERKGALFPASDLRRGDRLEVEVSGSDGMSVTPSARSGEIQVGNSPPTIVSRPPRPNAVGYFRYQIRVEDPDGDVDFQFGLREAPDGMEIDESSGVVTWTPGTDQAGRHAVEVVVSDDGGAETTQSFSLALVSRTDSGGGPAALR